MSDLENAADPTRGPGPWFTAHSPGACSRCGDLIEPGDTIRADGWGSWECCDEEEADDLAAADHEHHYSALPAWTDPANDPEEFRP